MVLYLVGVGTSTGCLGNPKAEDLNATPWMLPHCRVGVVLLFVEGKPGKGGWGGGGGGEGLPKTGPSCIISPKP